MATIFDQLSSLDTSKTNWRIKVRLTRMWTSVSNATNGNEGAKGYNLILLDDDDSHVHAYVYANTWKGLSEEMVEGGVYIITNFNIKPAKGSLKPVSSNIVINFSPKTHVEKLIEDDFMIPNHKFEFVDLSDLVSIAKAYTNVEFPDYSIDVIGVIEHYTHLTKINTMYGEREIVNFQIKDGSHSHKVTIWGPLAVSVEADYNKITEESIIVILASFKLKTFYSSAQLNSIPSSKVYLNLDTDVVAAMRQKLIEEGYTAPEKILESPAQSEIGSATVLETLTLKELSQKTNTEDLKKSFLCKVKIINVEEGENWWYYCCNKNNCHAEVTKLEGKYKCYKCNRNFPVVQKRYRIVVLAEDDTEAFNVVLLDRAAKRLTGKTATKIIAERIEVPPTKEYPKEIRDIKGKDITLKFELNDDNILAKSSIYYATDAYESCVTTSSMSDATISSNTNSGYGDNGMANLSNVEDTPVSAKSSTKKIKMED